MSLKYTLLAERSREDSLPWKFHFWDGSTVKGSVESKLLSEGNILNFGESHMEVVFALAHCSQITDRFSLVVFAKESRSA
jgi:hypothetical protein